MLQFYRQTLVKQIAVCVKQFKRSLNESIIWTYRLLTTRSIDLQAEQKVYKSRNQTNKYREESQHGLSFLTKLLSGGAYFLLAKYRVSLKASVSIVALHPVGRGYNGCDTAVMHLHLRDHWRVSWKVKDNPCQAT